VPFRNSASFRTVPHILILGVVEFAQYLVVSSTNTRRCSENGRGVKSVTLLEIL
jgi:hypothetical protein